MREDPAAVIGATITLELGIDLGQLERVIQLDAPVSVASFLQRLGRTGRRNNPADMRFICTEKEQFDETNEAFPQRFPWQLLQCIAIIQLYLEERWIERFREPLFPFSLLYHQTLSAIAGAGEMPPPQLAQEILTLPTFAHIPPEDYRQLLNYLINLDHLQRTESGALMLGLEGEKIVNRFQFYGVFNEQIEYKVNNESGQVGKIGICPMIGSVFALAGRYWRVIEIDRNRKTLWVKPTDEIGKVYWRGTQGVTIATEIMQKMRQILSCDRNYAYLQPQGQKRLLSARNLAKRERLDSQNYVELDSNLYCYFPWLGTVSFQTLERIINLHLRSYLDIKSVKTVSPYYFIFKFGECSFEQFYTELSRFVGQIQNPEELVFNDVPKLHKYDQFIPNYLLKKAFAQDYLNLEEIKKIDFH